MSKWLFIVFPIALQIFQSHFSFQFSMLIKQLAREMFGTTFGGNVLVPWR